LAEHPHARFGMGQAGRAAVKRLFDIEKLNDRLVEIYSGLNEAGPLQSRLPWMNYGKTWAG
jgi:hypothetical protein